MEVNSMGPTSDAASVTPEVVHWAYRLFLGRAPENNDVVDLYMRDCPSIGDVVRELVKSREFRLKRLSESGISPLVPEDKQYVLTELDDGTRFWINMKDRYVSRAIHMNDYEGMETAFVRSTLHPGMRVLDIGANLGWFTVLMAKLVGPTGDVTSFEPRSDLFHYLSRTVVENRLNWVRLHNCALGDTVGEVELHWPKDGINPGGTQLHVAQSSTDRFYYQKIGMKVLDQEVAGKIDFIKIDVEGAEKLVFSGARRILSDSKPLIMAEVSPDALRQVSKVSFDEYIEFIKSIHYTPYKFTDRGTRGERLTSWPYSDPTMLINVVMVPEE